MLYVTVVWNVEDFLSRSGLLTARIGKGQLSGCSFLL